MTIMISKGDELKGKLPGMSVALFCTLLVIYRATYTCLQLYMQVTIKNSYKKLPEIEHGEFHQMVKDADGLT